MINECSTIKRIILALLSVDIPINKTTIISIGFGNTRGKRIKQELALLLWLGIVKKEHLTSRAVNYSLNEDIKKRISGIEVK